MRIAQYWQLPKYISVHLYLDNLICFDYRWSIGCYWHISKQKNLKDGNPYASVDPSPPAESKDITNLTEILLNEDEKLFERYRAIFSLRNIQTIESINALGKGLKCKSALFRHEIAFVLGQIQNECSIKVLTENLQNTNENEMVRHECAEALGAIATDKCIEILNQYLNDEKPVVKESCIVALDMCEYENSPEFQYANALTIVQWTRITMNTKKKLFADSDKSLVDIYICLK